MFWIIANDCACLIILSVPEYFKNKLNYGALHQLPATSGQIKSKQQTFTLNSEADPGFKSHDGSFRLKLGRDCPCRRRVSSKEIIQIYEELDLNAVYFIFTL